MAKYRAIENFADNGIVYNIGDDYPRDGKAEKEKVNAFLSENNGFKRPIIEDVSKVSDDIGGYSEY